MSFRTPPLSRLLIGMSPLLLATALVAGCGDEPASVVPDATGTDVDAASPQVVPDASKGAPSGDAKAETPEQVGDAGDKTSPVGTWELLVETYVWQSDYSYELKGDGSLVILHQRVDRNGARADCLQRDRAMGTWTVNGNVLNIEATGGRTIRNNRVNAGQCGLGKDWSYAERDMIADELKLLDFADGTFLIDGDLLSTTDANGIKWNWSRKN